MCGLAGWSWAPNIVPIARRQALAIGLALASAERGSHAWGTFLWRNGPESKVRRGVGSIENADLAIVARADTAYLHTRYATVGENLKENAHPFTVGRIVLAHNGGVFNHAALDTAYGRHCAVDSQHLACHLAEGKSFADLEGYGAIEYANLDDPGVIYLCRMAGGELTILQVLDGKKRPIGVVWASEEEAAATALDTAGLSWRPYAPMEEGTTYRVIGGVLQLTREPARKLAGRRIAEVQDWAGWPGLDESTDWPSEPDEPTDEPTEEGCNRWLESHQ